MMKSYKELVVWQKAIGLVTTIYQQSQTFPTDERYGLVSQMRRAAVSVPSNIAEGWGRGATKDYIRFLRIARGSLTELETQLIIATNLNFLENEKLHQLSSQVQEIGRMLNGLISSLKNREATNNKTNI